MMLADGFVFVWVGGALLLGFVGFFFAIIAALANLVRRVFRPLFRCNARSDAGVRNNHAVRMCPQRLCGHANPARARFCARCGTPLIDVTA